MFVHFNDKLISTAIISWVDYRNLSRHGYVRVHYTDNDVETVEGTEAIQLMMALDSSALEGQRLKHARHTWAIHNLIGHPLMQICAWLHLTQLGLFIHDITVPTPITKDR